ncbi:MAG: methionine ABC transporter ATP-binding protein [Bifidobacterium tibiigranuli]|jgi:D-methionine transport system ATP-binding protein|uniref:methionine ABC transporter ATP-binding protein n=1 Tax=Bifidobacterium tibiigranuli TaxID=2172043 RepID=UPI0026F0EC99|nr:methionine ABC transporter ATP-binding protein [Bifidobacterium tibiigranuli]MCI1673938.1 methionine ABC transporter ATP-binding protein [Bifidobacterium tibiigranuli]MCI1712187.1 methionine ABC transporter ATP-binding protein [Bifidobacterium tibiigranuli]
MAEAIITLDHVVKEFHKRGGSGRQSGTSRAVDDVSLRVNRGDIFGIIGYSGAGKSTLVRMINALERPTSGTVSVLDTDITALGESKLRPIRQKIGMIFQQFNLFSTKTVSQNIAYPLQLDHWRKDYQERRVAELLDFVGLRDHADNYPSQLSGGQKQRVGIARALATNPQILLADEATSALDPETTDEVLALLKRVNEQFGITIVLITHQMSVVQNIANRVAVMSQGRVVEQGDVYDVFAAPRQPVTKRFIATALSGVPQEERVEQLRRDWPGRIVTVLIRQRDVLSNEENNGKENNDGQLSAVPASGQRISQLIASSGIASSMLYGGIDTVGGSAIGAITYEFDDQQEGFEAFFDELTHDSDVVDFGTASHPIAYEQAVASLDSAAARRTTAEDVTDIAGSAGFAGSERTDGSDTKGSER